MHQVFGLTIQKLCRVNVCAFMRPKCKVKDKCGYGGQRISCTVRLCSLQNFFLCAVEPLRILTTLTDV